MPLRPDSFPFSLSINHHCTRQCPRNDPGPRDSQLRPWGPLSVAALTSSASSFGSDFSKRFGLFCLCGPQRPDVSREVHPTPQWDAEHPCTAGRAGSLPAAGCAGSSGSRFHLPCPLAAGSLPTPHSMISCNTTCVADTEHLGLELGPLTRYILSGSCCF